MRRNDLINDDRQLEYATLMGPDKVYKQAIKRAFAGKYHDEPVAIYWGRGDETIHVIASFTHYMHSIASAKSNVLEFIAGNGDRIVVGQTRSVASLDGLDSRCRGEATITRDRPTV
jgi:hypothetical protein